MWLISRNNSQRSSWTGEKTIQFPENMKAMRAHSKQSLRKHCQRYKLYNSSTTTRKECTKNHRLSSNEVAFCIYWTCEGHGHLPLADPWIRRFKHDYHLSQHITKVLSSLSNLEFGSKMITWLIKNEPKRQWVLCIFAQATLQFS
jgi:hypothetical protein